MKTGSPRFIIITGPKHSGKTLCSRALGKITGREIADLDDIVKKQTGKPPGVLFNEGPEIFRKAEAKALASLINAEPERSGFIIAAGGGLIDNPEALALLPESAVQLYLDISAETAWQRILDTAAGGDLPPFLNTENPRETHSALHKRRCEAYRALALFTVSTENKSPDEIAGEIKKRLDL